MKTIIKRSVLLFSLALFIISQAISQPVYQVNQSKSKLIISGTSSLHDWTMEADDYSCRVMLDFDGKEVENLSGINFSLPVKNIKSESNLMDKKAYEALKEDKSPVISFRQTSLEKLNSSSGQLTGQVTGNLTVAGKTKQITISFTGKVLDNSYFTVSGKLPVKMSDFGVDPPTAMLGTLKTGDAVTLEYSFEFNPDLTSTK